MPRLIYDATYLTEAGKANIVPQVVGMVEISSGGFAPGTITAHATYPLPSPYNYDGRLREVSSIDCSLNGAFGRVSFAITNADLVEVPNVAADKYVGWECKVHKIIILEDGTLLGILLLHGVIMSYTMTDRVVEMDVLTRINVGNTITPRRVNVKCPWVFKGTECGYSGVLTDCNKLYSDAGGCSGRSNQHRFGGFPLRLPEASIGAVSGQGSAPTYQLIRDDSAFQLQRAILEFDNTFSVTDDPTNNKTVISVTGGGGGGSGTVTSVALTAPSILTVTGSPITTSGTLALALATQSAGTVFAGPATGSAVAPTFRALVATDIPDLSSIYQPLDADLTAIAALTANGLLRKTAGTWAMDSASYLTSNQTITLTGDVTGSGATSIATTIANDAVSYAKMQNVSAASRILGRGSASGSGDVQELTVGTGLSISGTTINNTGVTSVGLSAPSIFTVSNSPVTTSGTLTFALNTQTANQIFAGPASGANDVPTFRAMVTNDIPDEAVTYAKIQDISATSRVLGRRTSAAGPTEECTLSQVLDFVGSPAHGDFLYRGSSTWDRLAAGTSGQVLQTRGSSANPAWVDATTFRNLLINGAMQVSQRATSSTGQSTSGYYTADRWHMLVAGTAGTWTQAVENDAPSGSGFRRSLKMTCTASKANLASGDQLVIQQRIEGQNAQSILKGTSNARQLTLSFWVKAGTTGTYIAELQDNDNTRFASISYQVNATNTWEKKTITFPADTSGVLDNDNAFSLAVNFWLAAGTNFTSGSLQSGWQTTTSNRATGQVNLAAGQAAGTNYWQITGVQLEIGAVATAFEMRPIQFEFEMCRRYTWRIKGGSSNTNLGPGVASSGTNLNVLINFGFAMRASPTMTANFTSATLDDFASTGPTVATLSIFFENEFGCDIVATDAGGTLTAGKFYLIFWKNASNFIQFTAEL